MVCHIHRNADTYDRVGGRVYGRQALLLLDSTSDYAIRIGGYDSRMCIKKECRWIKSSQALRKTFKKNITN